MSTYKPQEVINTVVEPNHSSRSQELNDIIINKQGHWLGMPLILLILVVLLALAWVVPYPEYVRGSGLIKPLIISQRDQKGYQLECSLQEQAANVFQKGMAVRVNLGYDIEVQPSVISARIDSLSSSLIKGTYVAFINLPETASGRQLEYQVGSRAEVIIITKQSRMLNHIMASLFARR